MTVELPLAAAFVRHSRQTPEVVGAAMLAACAANSPAWLALPDTISLAVPRDWLASKCAPHAVLSMWRA